VHSEGIWCMDIDDSANPDFGSAMKILATNDLLVNPVLSPDGDTLLVEQPWTSTNSRIWFIKDIADVLADTTLPVEDLESDPRVYLLNPDDSYATDPQTSQDGSLIYYVKDVTLTLDLSDFDGTFYTSDFDVVVLKRSEIVANMPNENILPIPGHQFSLHASSGGTRFAFANFDVTEAQLNLGSLIISATVMVDPSGITQEELTLVDGSGLRLVIPAGTLIQGITIPGDGLITLTIHTPITPFEELALANLAGVKLTREFGPSGITFDPPEGESVALTIHYTDAEVEGLDENELTLVEVTLVEVDGIETIPHTIIARDPAANTITAELTGFSLYAMSGNPIIIEGLPIATGALVLLILLLSLAAIGITRNRA